MTQNGKDRRGQMVRVGRKMSEEEARAFLAAQKIAHVGTADERGWPYVVPLTFVHLGDEFVWLHTGAHQGHFLSNLQHDPRVCLTVSEIGGMETNGQYLCDGSQLYGSVVVFGVTRIIREDPEIKTWFFDRLREKYVPREISDRLSGEYPDIGKIIVYQVRIDRMTGKRSSGIGH